MNIILLSGGSGKRLWPLSNDVRSKQFIKLFKNEKGEYESMVQRVYRQITKVDPEAKVTIATSKSQASAIKNQLGENVSICVEPCRRDTFPAIALAANYLHDVLDVKEDEPVVVCPVDPYVEDTYYEAVKELAELAQAGNAGLTLMGIEPTYPSEKYGYIIPKDGDNVSAVKEFKEKPDTETAKKYLAQNALWNAGIFAFKLGYLIDKAHSMAFNQFVSGRINLAAFSLEKFGYSFWGGNLDYKVDTGLPYFLVDSGMILLLQDWGFLMMIISMVIFVFMMWRFWKNRQDILIITGIVVALWSMNEDVLISVGMNFLFFAIGANLDISKINDRMRRRKLEG